MNARLFQKHVGVRVHLRHHIRYGNWKGGVGVRVGSSGSVSGVGSGSGSLISYRSYTSSNSWSTSRSDSDTTPSRCIGVGVGDVTLYDSLSGSFKSIPVSGAAVVDNDDGDHTSHARGVAWYTCGPTVYDSAHLGHARTYVSLDIIQRALLHNYESQLEQLSSMSSRQDIQVPPPPMFIMNVTDVDDKILIRAKERNIHPLALARHYEQEFWDDMDALNVMRPTVVTRVTDHVESSIVPYIQKIMDNGMAYVMKDDDGDDDHDDGHGSVYFDVRAFESATGTINKYGKLASNRPASDDTFFQWEHDNDNDNDTAQVVNDEDDDDDQRRRQKKDPRDFVLWKSRIGEGKDNDNGNSNHEHDEFTMNWDSPWGKGRPGWHIECSAMIDRTMEQFEKYDMHVHAGGVDLKFPHHTNEIAQAEAYRYQDHDARDKEWIPHWVHTGHLHIDGLKMSKSLKNFITIRDILKSDDFEEDQETEAESSMSSPADDFRLWCLGLSGSYRGPATYSKSRLVEARVTRQKILRFLMDGEQWVRRRRRSAYAQVASSELSMFMSSIIWSREEHDLVQLSSECRTRCERALRGLKNSPACDEGQKWKAKAAFDFDGSSYLLALIELSEAGTQYILNTSNANANTKTNTNTNTDASQPTFPVERAIAVLRKCLSIVGFSEKTTRAGLLSSQGSQSDNIRGGEESLIEELLRFRSSVRETALDHLKLSSKGEGKEGSDDDSVRRLSKELLAKCDDFRDNSLPSIGLEIFDGDAVPKWRYCMPRAPEKKPLKGTQTSKAVSNKANNIGAPTAASSSVATTRSNYFQIGQYDGRFLSYDPDGIPTHNVDGSEVSKRMRKKLTKKRESFFAKQT